MIIMILAQCCTADATLDSLPQLRLCECSPDFPTPQEIQLSNTCNQLMHCEKYMCNLMFFLDIISLLNFYPLEIRLNVLIDDGSI